MNKIVHHSTVTAVFLYGQSNVKGTTDRDIALTMEENTCARQKIDISHQPQRQHIEASSQID